MDMNRYNHLKNQIFELVASVEQNELYALEPFHDRILITFKGQSAKAARRKVYNTFCKPGLLACRYAEDRYLVVYVQTEKDLRKLKSHISFLAGKRLRRTMYNNYRSNTAEREYYLKGGDGRR